MVIDNLYYGDNCSCCAGHFHNEAAHSFAINSEVLQEYLRTIYKGFDTSDAIEPTMWRAVLKVLNEATVEGLSRSNTDMHDHKFLASLRHSNEVFAAFKVHSMGEKMAEKLLDDKGKLKPFREWKEDVKGIASHYVGSWLETEYNTAVIRAHNAADWQQFERDADIMPNLRWMPTTSPHPESSHKKFWERQLTLPVSDPFWDKHHPGDRWNCKCSLEQTDEPATPELKEEFRGEKPQRGLANNPGKDGRMFSQDHPYFPKSCSSCNYYKPNLKNKICNVFTNKSKDCYNCPYINGCITRLSSNGFKLENIFENGGKLYIHPNIDKDKNDYKDMKCICLQLAKMGHEVYMTPRLHCRSDEYRRIYGSLIGTKYENKCPDFSVDGIFYEYEGFVKPWKKKKVGRKLSHGIDQSDHIVIKNTKGCSDRFIRKQIIARQRQVPNAIKEVLIYEKGKVRQFFIDGMFIK